MGGHYHQMMAEVGELFTDLLDLPTPDRMTYQHAFLRYADCDPLTASDEDLLGLATEHGLTGTEFDRDDLLNFLVATLLEPQLVSCPPVFLYDYPDSQAALARVRPGSPPLAERFELYVRGMELCNGYQELTDPVELRRRSHRQNRIREAKGKKPLPVNSHLISAMEAGLPECSGVALGFDRLVMLADGCKSLAEVLAFPFDKVTDWPEKSD